MTLELSLTRAEVQARQIRMAASANGWDATDLHDALAERGSDLSYDRVRRLYYGDFKRDIGVDLADELAEATGFSREWIQGLSTEVPVWLAKKRVHIIDILGLTTHQVFADAA